MESLLFWGRFHAVLVHLPIGLLLAAGLLEGLSLKPRWNSLGKSTSWLLLGTWLSGALAVWMGWSLAEAGRHAGDTLEWHRWLGISLVILSALLWLVKMGWLKLSRRFLVLGLGVAAGLVTATGHLGGELTHGEGYLSQFAPDWLITQPRRPSTTAKTAFPMPDSLHLYADLIEPILQQKCVRCHGGAQTYGNLDMSSWEAIAQGGKDGPLWQAGSAVQSHLIQRVSLATHDLRFMPPSGEPLTYPETRLISWWIEQGAEVGPGVPEEIPGDVLVWLDKQHGLDLREKPYVQVAGAQVEWDQASVDALRESGWRVKPLAADNNLLEVIAPDTTLSETQWQALAQAAPMITWLTLAKAKGSLTPLADITDWVHLTRLDLSEQTVPSQALEQLTQALNLETLILKGGTLPEKSGEWLAQMKSLQRVFLWQSNFPASEIEQLRQARPELEVDTGFQWQ